MEGSAKITNLTLADGAYITLTGDLTSERAAEITLASSAYAIGTKILENNTYTEANCAKFKIVDNDPTDTKEWYVKSDGSLSHKVNFGPDEIENITVFENESDIEVTNEKTGFTYKFTAPEGYSYSWKVDGTETGTENVLILNAITWGTGIYDVYLTASKDGKTYSYHAQINHQLVTEFTGTAEECAEYINALTVNETYNVTVTGPVGPGDTDGLMQVANAIRSRHYGIYINLDARGTSNSSDIDTYNNGAYFHDCTALKSIKLPNWMKALITNLFAGCTKLETVDIPNEVQQIKTGAFKNCTSITSISLPQKLTGNGINHGLEAGAFEGCSALTSISYAGDKEEWKNIKFGKSSTSPKTWRDGVPATSVNCSDCTLNLNYIDLYTVYGKLKTGTEFNVSFYPEGNRGSGSQADPYIFAADLASVQIILKSDFTYELKFDNTNVTATAGAGGVTEISISDEQRTAIGGQTICGTIENTDYKVYFKIEEAPSSVAALLSAPTSGTYSLSTLSELEKIKDWVSNNNTLQNVTFTLEADIDTNGEELIIGYYKYSDSANRAFMGVFDGNNHTITNKITASDVNTSARIALFSYVKGSSTVIKNLTVKGTSTRGSIVGYLDGNATVENCISETEITTSVNYIGGVVCYLEKGYVKNCINKGALTSEEPHVAGVVGYTNSGSGAIDRCINKGNISGSTSTGGIIGYMQSDIPITNCKNYGNITNGSTCGGIIGFFSADNAKAYNNCNLGEVQTGSGIVRTVDSTINISNNCNSNTANYGVIGKFDTYLDSIVANNNYSLNVYTIALYPSTASGSFNPSTITEAQIKSFELSEASSIVESLNTWATTNSTSSLPYASWKLNADGKPELDLGEMDTW